MKKGTPSCFVAVRSLYVAPNATPISPAPGSLLPRFPATAFLRHVRKDAKKLPSGNYVKTEIYVSAWDLKEIETTDGIFKLDGTRLLPVA